MKIESQNSPETLDLYKSLIKVLDINFKALKAANSDQQILDVYGKLIRHLKSQETHEILKIIGRGKSSPKYKAPSPKIPDAQIEVLTYDEIEALILNESNTRKFVERIGTIKFGLSSNETKGARNKQQLIEKILMLIENQRTHDAIKSLAGKEY